MTISSEITRLQGAKSDIRQAIIDKGVDVGAGLTLDEYAACINAIPAGAKIGFIDLLVVGGGAAGGGSDINKNPGGGGAGGYIELNKFAIDESCGAITIAVGSGGAGWNAEQGRSGCNSCFLDIIACGGGGGGNARSAGSVYGGLNGGSGGGGAAYNSNTRGGGSGIAGQGNKGGNAGGGGGGAGGEGNGGTGGAGRCSCISGSCQRYSGGGGGGISGVGQNGGGNAGGGRNVGCNATTYGSGGGGGYGDGGAGCQGVVILRYKTDGSCGICSTSTGGCKYTCGDYTIHCFTNTSATEQFIPVYK